MSTIVRAQLSFLVLSWLGSNIIIGHAECRSKVLVTFAVNRSFQRVHLVNHELQLLLQDRAPHFNTLRPCHVDFQAFRSSRIVKKNQRSGSGVKLRTLDYENTVSNPGRGVKTLGKFFSLYIAPVHSAE